ncbi:hypothetical protein CTRI78_v006954 [Colletotrichum trifolii]|uniref:Spt2 chromatin protein n=1 Tax=Colletotrichum trifolii TaxID=5466 RepID=A0A4R8RH34_COLTR|nr:hypothetical protein CTRI78_v006954 [Colletotrichum trifolii]
MPYDLEQDTENLHCWTWLIRDFETLQCAKTHHTACGQSIDNNNGHWLSRQCCPSIGSHLICTTLCWKWNGSRASSSLPSRPSPVSTPSSNGAPPKKGSYLEVLARAKKAQESMGQVGRIQHKPVEKTFTKKERDDIGKDAKASVVKGAAARQPSKFQGTARPSPGLPSRSGAPNGASNGAFRNGTVDRARDPRPGAKARVAEEEKKLKKAAVATTGYTGTARPRPGASTNKKKPAPGGALLNARPAPRYGGSAKRGRYDEEEDEDMDDFIDYDDEEDEGGPRYNYNSDASSDMEAGADDVWEEEQMAERVARLEDKKEEALERRLKAEKEERKRKFLEEQQRRAARR